VAKERSGSTIASDTGSSYEPQYDDSVDEVDLLQFERPLVDRGEVVVGIDEVGRGALAGPLVVGAAVIRTTTPPPAGLTDSKALRPAQRETLVPSIRAWVDDVALGEVSSAEIDAWGLRVALAVACERALNQLTVVPTMALIDGPLNLLRPPSTLLLSELAPPPPRWSDLPVQTLVKGDARSATIAAAAVVAKVSRDAQMRVLDGHAPSYGWAENKGYGSPQHLAALAQYGPTTWHRQSWSLPLQGEIPA